MTIVEKTCPVCGKGLVRYIPEMSSIRSEKITKGRFVRSYKKMEVLKYCEYCGWPKEKKLRLSKKKMIERLRQQGLPLKIQGAKK